MNTKEYEYWKREEEDREYREWERKQPGYWRDQFITAYLTLLIFGMLFALGMGIYTLFGGVL